MNCRKTPWKGQTMKSADRLCRPVVVVFVVSVLLALAAPNAVAFLPDAARGASDRDIDFYGWWHDEGAIWLHTCNLGFFGTYATSSDPSCEWPYASGYEHLFAGGFWVGARSAGDTLVSTSALAMEFSPPRADSTYRIYASYAGAPGGIKDYDDDGDGSVDEDRLDGLDNDMDGLIDEDYAAISEQMFTYVCFDTVTIQYPNPQDLPSPMGLEAYVQSFAWGEGPAENFVGVRYEITNIGEATLDDVYVGLMCDPDIGRAASDGYYLDDLSGFADATVPVNSSSQQVSVKIAHAHDAPGGPDGDWNGWFGIALLDHSATGSPPPDVAACRIWSDGALDPDNDRERYRMLRSGIIDPGVTTPSDCRFMMSVGPFGTLEPGESVFVDAAYVCGDKLDGLLANAAAAVIRHRSRLWNGSIGPRPRRPLRPVPERSEGVGESSPSDSWRTIALMPPSPNPTQTSVRLAFELAQAGHVNLAVYDANGRKMSTLINEEMGPGRHESEWSGEEVPTGVYFVKLMAGGETVTRRVVVLH